MFDVTPAIDVDCVDNETMLIVERDATEVIIPVGAALEEGVFKERERELGSEIPEVISMGIVPVPVEEVSVGGFLLRTVPLVEALAIVGVMIEGPLLERGVIEVLGTLVEKPVIVFMGMTVEESMLRVIEDEKPGMKKPLGVTELGKKIPLTWEPGAMEAVEKCPLVKELLIGMPFELMACCLGPSRPGYPLVKSAAIARIQRSSFIIIVSKLRWYRKERIRTRQRATN